MENNTGNETMEKKTTKGNISRKNYLWIIGSFTLFGVVGGYAYYSLIGCESGCTIQSNPYLSMVWGGAMGYLLPDIFLKPKSEE